jgi:hypothetical protein
MHLGFAAAERRGKGKETSGEERKASGRARNLEFCKDFSAKTV